MFKKGLQATAFVSSVLMTLGVTVPMVSQAATVKDDVNVRKGATVSSKIIGGLEKDEEVKILSESNGWYKIKDSDGEEGWSYGEFIKASDEEIENAKAVGGVVTEYLNFRKGPSTDEEILSVHEKGSTIKILSESDGWYKVKNEKGEVGWSYAKYIKSSDEKSEWSEEDTNGTFKDTANMRKGASTKYDVIKVVSKGEKVKVISALDGWYKLKTSDGKVGWTHGSHVDSSVALTPKSASKSNNKNTTSKKDSYSSEVSSKRKMTVSATAYSGDGITATGTTPRWGTIAVDPKVIPYGTKVYIPRFGKTFIAEDCGGGIKGNRIDIFMNSESQCNNWGVRSITIQIVD